MSNVGKAGIWLDSELLPLERPNRLGMFLRPTIGAKCRQVKCATQQPIEDTVANRTADAIKLSAADRKELRTVNVAIKAAE